jgi:hypothetical protein
MVKLFTHGRLVVFSAAQFSGLTAIQVSSTDSTSSVQLGLSVAGAIDFTSRLGMRSAEIYGTRGGDHITSGRGEDTLWGLGGNDTLNGSAGNDLLFGDATDSATLGHDLLLGGAGNDSLVAGPGNDRLYGGNGDDTFFLATKWIGRGSYYGGLGVDAMIVSDPFAQGHTKVTGFAVMTTPLRWDMP